jgi:hypothetical protein
MGMTEVAVSLFQFDALMTCVALYFNGADKENWKSKVSFQISALSS